MHLYLRQDSRLARNFYREHTHIMWLGGREFRKMGHIDVQAVQFFLKLADSIPNVKINNNDIDTPTTIYVYQTKRDTGCGQWARKKQKRVSVYHNDREGHHNIQKPEINVLEAVALS